MWIKTAIRDLRTGDYVREDAGIDSLGGVVRNGWSDIDAVAVIRWHQHDGTVVDVNEVFGEAMLFIWTNGKGE